MSVSQVADNVVSRLRRRVSLARSAGIEVRFEHLADEQPGWCQIGKRRFILLNTADTAAEQLVTLNELMSAVNMGNH